jgi:hypothetical protein
MSKMACRVSSSSPASANVVELDSMFGLETLRLDFALSATHIK